MKKTLAILLALAMVFSTVTVAFAEDAISADAQAAVKLGMLKGEGAGVTSAYLAQTPSRLTAAILFLRLKGLENTALAYTGTDNFADVDQVNWAGGKAILGYLKANPTLGWVGDQGKFDPNAPMTAQGYYKVMLEALGYKQNTSTVIGQFTWDGVIAFAAEKGLTKVATVTNFTVNDVAIATVEALKAKVADGSKTLAAQLVDLKVITEADAVAAGVYTVVPATLAVESVKAINLKETVVTFNKEVDEDSAEDLGNYLLDDEDIAASIALNDDKKSVTITWDTALANQTEFDLTVSDVEDLAGNTLDEVTVTFLANDVTLPVADSMKLVGPNKIKLTFSEPINDDEDLVKDYSVTVEDKDFDYEVAAVTIDGNEATVELSDESLEAGDYTVTVTGFQDYAELKNLKKTFTLAYAKDTTAPVAKITKATQTYVTVEFNKPVYKGDAGEKAPLDAAFFYHTYKNYEPAFVYTSDFETYKVYFTTDAADRFIDTLSTEDQAVLDATDDVYTPLQEGNVKFVVKSEDDSDNVVTDEWGNEMADDAVLTATIAPDTTAPTVTKVEVENQKTVNVYFSEDVTAEADNFTIVDKDGEDVDFTLGAYDTEDYYYPLTFSSNLEGDYTLTVEDVVDNGSLEGNEITKVEKKFTVADKTAPNLLATDAVVVIGVDKEGGAGQDADETKSTDADYIYVTFPEDMATTGTYSVLNKDNYQIFDNNNNTYYDLKSADKIATFGGNDRIKITLDNSAIYDVSSGDIAIVVGRVADALGNVTKGNNANAAFDVYSETMPTISEVKTLTKKTVEITINGELKAVNKSFILVNHGANTPKPLYSISSWKLDDGDTIITGVLPSTEYLASSDDVNLTVTLTTDDLVTVAGTKVDYDTFSSVDDGIAPAVVKDGIVVSTSETATFTITFDEALFATDEALFAHDLVVKDSKGNILVAGTDYKTTVVNGNTVKVVIQDPADQETGDYKVYSKDTINYIKDLSKNKAKAFTTSKTLEDLVQ